MNLIKSDAVYTIEASPDEWNDEIHRLTPFFLLSDALKQNALVAGTKRQVPLGRVSPRSAHDTQIGHRLCDLRGVEDLHELGRGPKIRGPSSSH